MTRSDDAFAFDALAKVDLADAVVDRIRDAILVGDLPVGSSLPSERELVVQLGVNRTTVREGLARLELLGVIDRRQGTRCRVIDYRRHGSLELLPALARLGVRDVGRSINEMVGIFHEGTVALAAERATEQDAAELADLAGEVERAAASGDLAAVVAADRRFQAAVVTTARSVALELVASSFTRAFDLTLDQRGRVRTGTARLLVDLHRAGTELPQRRLATLIAAHDVVRARSVAAKAIAATAPTRRPRPGPMRPSS